jgi:IgA Peptidase M64/Peptidase M64 N-terminus
MTAKFCRCVVSCALFLIATIAFAAGAPRTMRVDYYHTGNAKHETFSLDRVVVEPLPWPGNPNRAIDDTNLGKYYFEVIDRSTNRALYSRGFASIFGEWEDTDEAQQPNRTFSESLRFPAPTAPVQIVLKKREANNAFREIWTTVIDPKDMFVDTSTPPSPGNVIALEKNGDSANKVDFLILGDGYTKADEPKCENDGRRLMEILFSTSPFKERRKDFNTWLLCPASQDGGISRPSTGVHKQTAIGATYDAFGSERYILTFDNKKFRDVAEFAPYEFVEILVNDKTYGGGGIFNLYSTVAADSLWAPYIFVHEFGHHFAGLADEYFTSDAPTANAPHVEPWEPNVTALLDSKDLKWKDQVTAGTPVPTPWKQAEFEALEKDVQARRRELRKENRPESEMNALFKEEKAKEDALFASDRHSKDVGAFQGANYDAKFYYRPMENCIMFSRTNFFCDVCKRAIERVVDLYTK